ncbi:Sodium/hydrogen exchanger [Xylariaceae sp. FL0594]|nr:Sodium/hydrogen exchanger [Xylariaceae sp. FL0594]
MPTPSSLPYREPGLIELLISSSFLLALNVVNSVLDRAFACGLVGQVLVGTAWGRPGLGWLSLDLERVVPDLGYLGLILVVFSGGLETDVGGLRKDLALSAAVALTGVAVPIALSFGLLASSSSSLLSLQAFAAGAALCSTSLGTTFSVLQASGLSRTRLGAVLASAALLDDVVGLVMVRIITSLGKKGGSGMEAGTILRPVLVSLGFAVVVPISCRYLLKPGKRGLDGALHGSRNSHRESNSANSTGKAKVVAWTRSSECSFIFQTALLILLVVAADYAGASILLASYLAGVAASWCSNNDIYASPLSHRPAEQPPTTDRGTESDPAMTQAGADVHIQHHSQDERPGNDPASPSGDKQPSDSKHTATEVFDRFYGPAVHRILKPFFFASIGFSIPISKLFARDIVWRGIVYSILMIMGKLVCGLWLVRFPMVSSQGMWRSLPARVSSGYNRWLLSGARASNGRSTKHESQDRDVSVQPRSMELSTTPQASSPAGPSRSRPDHVPSTPDCSDHESAIPPKPLSLYPAAVLGCAMVARGEIGFLISSTAESGGVFRRPDEDVAEVSELFLIITWAIFLCTILGPVCTGLLVRRIKRLEMAGRVAGRAGRNVLGAWGVG